MGIIVNVRFQLAILGVATLLACGCGRNIQNQEAVRKGVVTYLSQRTSLDINAMQVDVSSVTFRENEADAVVSFKPKGSTDPNAGMSMSYTLERKGNEWVVKGKAGKSGAPAHGEGMAMPGAAGPGGQMPPAHPPMGGEAAPKAGGPPAGTKK